MARRLFQFSYLIQAIKNMIARPPDRRDAMFILEDIDKYRNLHTSVAILCFFVSAGCGVLAFFVITEALLWPGLDKQAAISLVSIAWVLIFLIWAGVFLLIMSALGLMGIKDVRSAVRYGLSNLALSPAQLRALQEILASRRWRHGRIYESVLADLTRERLEA